jgi:hypothetical protein
LAYISEDFIKRGILADGEDTPSTETSQEAEAK